MQGSWGRRFIALVVDAVIITLFSWILVALTYPVIALTNSFQILGFWLLILAFIIIIYFTYFEGKYGATPGKNLMKLKVKAQNGDMDYMKAFIRNLSKILWLPLIVDLLVGFLFGSPRKRYLDRLAKTEVVKVEEVEKSRKKLCQSIS
jgi:uncharacterized RDD family membrane protein YckC